jgi:hypothetical protein
MARKKLLTEGEVRQFMKLANLGPLSENYFTNNPLDEQDEDEFASVEVEEPLPGGGELDVAAGEEEVPPVDDAGLGGEEGGEAENLVMGLLQAVQGWAEEMGVDMELDGDEEGGEEFEDVEGLEGELEVEEPLPGGGGLEAGGEEEEFPPANMDDVGYQEGRGGPDFPLGRTRQPNLQRGTKHTDTGAPVTPQRRQSPKARPAAPAECVPGDQKCEEEAAAAAAAAAGGQNEAIVAEVARRVAARLNADKRKEQMAEQLANKIFERLTSK